MPLDWGLGHTTRCIPIIHCLQLAGYEIVAGVSGAAAALMAKECPNVAIIPIKGYKVSYTRLGWLFSLKIFLQIPKIFAAIIYEYQWLQKTIVKEKIDMVISDNRYGCFTKNVPCFFITHQLAIQTGTLLTNWMVQQVNYWFIKQYNACFVPDVAANEGLAGRLAHPKKLPKIPLHYLGILARINAIENKKQDIDFLALVSGPEPQRTLLEQQILALARQMPTKQFCLLRGLPNHSDILAKVPNNISYYNHLPAQSLSEVVAKAQYIICRSGYTTVMELVTLQKKCLLLPTPGQTEQLYLAKFLQQKGYCYYLKNGINKASVQQAVNFAYKPPSHLHLLNESLILRVLATC